MPPQGVQRAVQKRQQIHNIRDASDPMSSQGTCANPILLSFLKEWVDEAKALDSKGYVIYKKAYEAMKVNPIVFTHPSEASVLKGIGPKLVQRMEKKLEEYCLAHDMPIPEKFVQVIAAGTGEPKAKRQKTKPYVPVYRSGAYGILRAMAEFGDVQGKPMTKTDIIHHGQQYCDSNFEVASDSSKFYTAWASMKTIVDKGLVYKNGNPPRYSLSDEGLEIAKKIVKVDSVQGGSRLEAIPEPDLPFVAARQASLCTVSNQETREPPLDIAGEVQVDPEFDFAMTILPKGSFDVKLVLDTREVRSPSDREYIPIQLQKRGVNPIIRPLEVGDCLWIATDRQSGKEIVLDFILERKRMDDLITSIKDGRFQEQKFRLTKSEIKNIIYLVEESHMGQFEHFREAVQTAMSSVQVCNGFFLKKCKTLDETIEYYALMTKALIARYKDVDLHCIPDDVVNAASFTRLQAHLQTKHPLIDAHLSYEGFASMTSKSSSNTVRDVFLKMLMAIRGVSAEKAVEIQKVFQTPSHLIQAYVALSTAKEKDLLISSRCVGFGRKKIGPALSAKIKEIWSTTG